MTRKEIKDWLSTAEHCSCTHEQLVSLVCVFEDDTGETEVVFAVPIQWLINYLDGLSGRREWDWERLARWLENEYTSEDSQPVLEEAVRSSNLAFWRIS